MLRGLFSDKVYQCEGTRAGVRESTLLRVCRSFDEVRSAWRALENEAHVSPFETLNWCENWWQHVGAKSGAQLVLVNGIGPDGNIGFILPLMEKKVGPISIAQSLGDKNAAYLSPIYRTAYLNWLDRQHNFSLALELKNFFPNIDAFVLKAQVAGLDQTAILGRDFTRTQTGNTISSVELGDDWASFDTGRRSSKARSKERNRENRLNKMGRFNFRVADTLGERMVMFDALVQQKSAWFKAHRIDDLFACESKLAFLRHLATQKQVVGDQWTLLSGLELNGEWISVNLGVVHREHYAGLILSIADSEAKRFSPGHLLITKTMQHCSDNGIRNFSFGAGDNDLKTKWSAENRSLTLATMPLTLRGRVYEMFLQNANRVKSSVKSNAFLWRQFKHLRGLSAK